jgi:hypothetical protein
MFRRKNRIEVSEADFVALNELARVVEVFSGKRTTWKQVNLVSVKPVDLKGRQPTDVREYNVDGILIVGADEWKISTKIGLVRDGWVWYVDCAFGYSRSIIRHIGGERIEYVYEIAAPQPLEDRLVVTVFRNDNTDSVQWKGVSAYYRQSSSRNFVDLSAN